MCRKSTSQPPEWTSSSLCHGTLSSCRVKGNCETGCVRNRSSLGVCTMPRAFAQEIPSAYDDGVTRPDLVLSLDSYPIHSRQQGPLARTQARSSGALAHPGIHRPPKTGGARVNVTIPFGHVTGSKTGSPPRQPMLSRRCFGSPQGPCRCSGVRCWLGLWLPARSVVAVAWQTRRLGCSEGT